MNNLGPDILWNKLLTKDEILDLSIILNNTSTNSPNQYPYWYHLGEKFGATNEILYPYLLNCDSNPLYNGGKAILDTFQSTNVSTVQNLLTTLQDIQCHDAVLKIADSILGADNAVVPQSHPLRSWAHTCKCIVINSYNQVTNGTADNNNNANSQPWSPGMVSTHLRDIWPPNINNLRIFFMEAGKLPQLEQKVMEYAAIWTNACGIKFVPTTDRFESHIRITFVGTRMHSELGKHATAVPKDKPTMCLVGIDRMQEQQQKRVILQMFGRVLGLAFEYELPGVAIPLDVQKTVKYFGRYGWRTEYIMRCFFNKKFMKPGRIEKPFDPLSIMMMPIPTDLLDQTHPDYEKWKQILVQDLPAELSQQDIQMLQRWYKPKM